MRSAVAVLFLAAVTGAAVALLGSTAAHRYGAVLYVAIVGFGLASTRAITAQVVVGAVLAGSLLWGRDGWVEVLVLLPLVAGVVATAELLAAAHRVRGPLARDVRPDVRRAGRSAVLAGAVFAGVLPFGALPSPTGLVAIGLASAACLALAVVLVRGS